MSSVEGAEVRRLAGEEGLSQRQIATRLGISRHRVRLLLAEPVGEPARPTAQPVAHVAEPVAQPVEPVAQPVEPVGEEAPAVPWLRIDLARRPRLLANLAALRTAGLTVPAVLDLLVDVFAHAYLQALARGEVRPGEPFQVHTRVRGAAAARPAA